MLLYGKPLANQIKIKLHQQVKNYFGEEKKYVAILFFWENSSSTTYVHLKQKYAKEIWLETFVFWQEKKQDTSKFPYLEPWTQKKFEDENSILTLIDQLNNDNDCVGIMIQLPLPEHLAIHKLQLLQAISEKKDIDGLGGSLVGKSFFGMLEFIPATPRAVLSLLNYYELGDMKGKRVAVVGQSTIVGKPLALECLKRWALVQCFDITNTQEEVQAGCQNADIILSGTGHIHLITDQYLNKKGNQILVDIGYGHLDWKPVGDVDFDKAHEKVAHITPVPGGVGPLTIASLFSNVITLREAFHS